MGVIYRRTDSQGDYLRTNYSAAGVKLSDAWTKIDGSHGGDTFNADGSSSGVGYYANGDYFTSRADSQGNFMQIDYSAKGVKLSDAWRKTDGSHGSDTFNADGSSSGIAYNADGSYVTTATDSLGNFMQTDFSAAGVKLSDAWTKTNGAHGGDTFNADGSSSGIAYNANGSYTDTTNDGQGDSFRTDYAANGTQTGDAWQNADGSHGGDTFNADGSGSGVGYYADGSRYTYTQDSRGDNFEQDYAANGAMTAEYWSYVNGLSESLVYNADGTHATAINDGKGGVTTTLYSAQGKKLSNSWQQANGETGGDVFNADGSVEAKVAEFHHRRRPSRITDTITSPDGFLPANLEQIRRQRRRRRLYRRHWRDLRQRGPGRRRLHRGIRQHPAGRAAPGVQGHLHLRQWLHLFDRHRYRRQRLLPAKLEQVRRRQRQFQLCRRHRRTIGPPGPVAGSGYVDIYTTGQV